jgi:hypothetical protein
MILRYLIIYKVLLNGWCRVHQTSKNTRSILTAGFGSQGVLNKDPIVWLDGTRTSPKSTSKIFKNQITTLLKSLFDNFGMYILSWCYEVFSFIKNDFSVLCLMIPIFQSVVCPTNVL